MQVDPECSKMDVVKRMSRRLTDTTKLLALYLLLQFTDKR